MRKTDLNRDNRVRGRVNIRHNERRGISRLRFTSVHPDQLEVILAALDKARAIVGTDYDVVALDFMAQHFLATCSGSDQDSTNETQLHTCADEIGDAS